MQNISILHPSLKSLFIEMYFNKEYLASGTGFVIEMDVNSFVLVTNRHNFTGRDHATAKPLSTTAAVPNIVKIHHHVKNKLGSLCIDEQQIYEDDEFQKHLWFEHPSLGGKVDVAILPLKYNPNLEYYPYVLDESQELYIRPTDIVSVVGFPFGLKVAECFPIWATGFVASEPEIDYQDLPVFLIDCRSRKGQSGSPVIAHRNGGGYLTANGDLEFSPETKTKFLGIYSGRINEKSDLGFVWKVEVIKEIMQHINMTHAM